LNIIFEPFSDPRFNQKFQLTINRSKPEIIQPIKPGEAAPVPVTAAAPSFLGKCIICYENIQSSNKPNLRAYEFKLNGRDFFLQYPPFPYFEKHTCGRKRTHTADNRINNHKGKEIALHLLQSLKIDTLNCVGSVRYVQDDARIFCSIEYR